MLPVLLRWLPRFQRLRISNMLNWLFRRHVPRTQRVHSALPKLRWGFLHCDDFFQLIILLHTASSVCLFCFFFLKKLIIFANVCGYFHVDVSALGECCCQLGQSFCGYPEHNLQSMRGQLFAPSRVYSADISCRTFYRPGTEINVFLCSYNFWIWFYLYYLLFWIIFVGHFVFDF